MMNAIPPTLSPSVELRLLALEHFPVGVVLCDASVPGLPIVYLNQKALQQTGYSSDELLGKNPRVLQGPASDWQVVREIRETLAAQGVGTWELLNYRKDGTTFWNELSLSLIKDDQGQVTHYLGIQRDVTKRRRLEEARQRAEGKTRALFDCLPSAGLIVTNAEGIIESWSTGAETLFGYSREEIIGRSVEELWPWEERSPERLRAHLEKAQDRTPYTLEAWRLRKDGTRFWGEIMLSAIRAQDTLVGYCAILQDRSAQKQLHDHLHQSEQRFRTLADAAPVLIWTSGPDGGCTYFNRPWLVFTGRTLEQEQGNGWLEAVHPEDKTDCVDCYRSAFERRTPFRMEYRLRRHDGVFRWMLDEGVPFFADQGLFEGYVGSLIDITERKENEQRLAEQESRLRNLTDNLPEGAIYQIIQVPNQHPRFTYFSESGARLFGVPIEEILTDPQSLYGLIPPEECQRLRASEIEAATQQHVLDFRFRHVTRDGQIRWIHLRSAPRPQPDGSVVWDGVLLDETARMGAELALRASEERLRLALNLGGFGTYDWDLTTNEIIWNRVHYEVFGYPTDMSPVTYQHFVDRIHPDDRAYHSRLMEGWMQQPEESSGEVRLLLPDGSIRWVAARGAFLRDADGKPLRMLGVIQDVTERKEAERDLIEREQFLEALFAGSPLGIQVFDPQGTSRRMNRAQQKILGVPSPNHGVGEYNLLQDQMAQQNGNAAAFVRAVQGEIVFLEDLESDFTHPMYDCWELKRRLWWADQLFFPVYNAKKTVSAVVIFTEDVTEQHLRVEEQKRLEEQLSQTQRLESLGVLAGGIAHDFNNILTSILGYANLTMNELPLQSQGQQFLQEIDMAARRAADLCQQMLAYAGKGRFVLSPVNLTQLVHEVTGLLKLSISKKATLRLELTDALQPIVGDVAQMRQVLMNLVMNASEALNQDGGEIIVRTCMKQVEKSTLNRMLLGENLYPGLYVELEVLDTGCGMDEATLNRIFEPFFTTKFTGRGLGLAAVLGIMRGHHGALQVESQISKGTCFRLLFPASAAPETPACPDLPLPTVLGKGTILLTEDEEAVRRLARILLESFGFQVLEATNGQEAVDEVIERGTEIRLVLLDMTMPILDGVQALDAIRQVMPTMPIIIMSGYSKFELRNVFQHQRPNAYLQKPFTREELGQGLRSVLLMETDSPA